MSAPAHSPIGPSAAPRWTSCTASVYYAGLAEKLKADRRDKESLRRLREFLPSCDVPSFLDALERWEGNRETVYAAEGTKAHAYGEKILRGEMKEEDLPEGFGCVTEYTSLCRTLKHRWDGVMLVESRSPLFYHPAHEGTMDCAVIARTPEGSVLFLNDYKHGAGILVDAVGNLQLVAYGLSFIHEYEMALDISPDTKVELRIIQPRASGDTEKLWVATVRELEELGEILSTAAGTIMKAVETGDASALVFSPGEKECRFCPVKTFCGARAATASEALAPLSADDFLNTLAGPSRTAGPAFVTPEQLVNLIRNEDVIKGILADARQYLLEQAVAGNPVPGTKLVEGRQGNRQWNDTEHSREVLLGMLPRAEVIREELISPSQAEKLLKPLVTKAALAGVMHGTSRAPGKPVLALESDKRPALADRAELLDFLPDETEQ